MDDREWMYTGQRSKKDFSPEWIEKTKAFLKQAFDTAKTSISHIWIERLLPVMVRGYVPEHIWVVLAELSYFSRQLCAKELSQTMIHDLERATPVLLCKLEKIFPPGFFLSIQHLILLLPYEARMGGGLCRPVGAIQSRDV
jgi:hypothetical protein